MNKANLFVTESRKNVAEANERNNWNHMNIFLNFQIFLETSDNDYLSQKGLRLHRETLKKKIYRQKSLIGCVSANVCMMNEVYIILWLYIGRISPFAS